jgi:6,7-dimethyl-8-ribityllumazine synthase
MKKGPETWPKEIAKPDPIEQGNLVKSELPVAIVFSRFNLEIGARLLEGATAVLDEVNTPYEIFSVPGAMELPLTAQKCAHTQRFAAIICLGAVIRGETPHFDYVCSEAARGCSQVGLLENLPVIFGVLTTNTLEQAVERASGEHGKGHYVAKAALESIDLFKKIEDH